ncbi:hypothetical protein [Arabiibacter massiliensis]|uniref:hypothetical protein n=1 Tax=Arabiibacter massiliensis TaxID=1870985 RepID=UPI0009BB6FFD|nr:hypothetical protein [Arabiibacter massiliensis]
MLADKKLWFKVAGICVGVGAVLMIASFVLVGGDLGKLQSPLPVGVSIVQDGVRIASDEPPAAPAAPQAPAAPAAPQAPQAPASFDAADKLDLANRALAHVIDLLM